MPDVARQAYRVERGTRASRVGALLASILLLVLIAAPWWADAKTMRTVVEFAYYLVLAQMWNLLAGYAGLVSVGQQAYVGLGGYALFLLANHLALPPLLAVPLAGLVAALVALPTAFIVFRLRGAYFAIGTWVVAEIYRLLFAQVGTLGGGSGQSLPADIIRSIASDRAMRDRLIYWLGLAIAVAAIAFAYGLLRSRHGLALAAIRDSESAAQSVGVDSFRAKLAVYLIAACGTGLAGGLIFLQKLRISPDAGFSVLDWTANVIFIVVIGGIGTIEGPIVGTLIFFLLRELLAGFGSWYLIILGCVAIVIMLTAPQGIWGFVGERWGWHLLPLRRRLNMEGVER
jgi:branched-chain amino acid transport system permease protein